jgi:hypothetical protein
MSGYRDGFPPSSQARPSTRATGRSISKSTVTAPRVADITSITVFNPSGVVIGNDLLSNGSHFLLIENRHQSDFHVGVPLRDVPRHCG